MGVAGDREPTDMVLRTIETRTDANQPLTTREARLALWRAGYCDGVAAAKQDAISASVQGEPTDTELAEILVGNGEDYEDYRALWRAGHAAGIVKAHSVIQAPDREILGRRVREVWVAWAKEQASPKPSWLVPWEGLSELDKEVDRRIGAELFLIGFAVGKPLTSDALPVGKPLASDALPQATDDEVERIGEDAYEKAWGRSSCENSRRKAFRAVAEHVRREQKEQVATKASEQLLTLAAPVEGEPTVDQMINLILDIPVEYRPAQQLGCYRLGVQHERARHARTKFDFKDLWWYKSGYRVTILSLPGKGGFMAVLKVETPHKHVNVRFDMAKRIVLDEVHNGDLHLSLFQEELAGWLIRVARTQWHPEELHTCPKS
jgi:hypothetical protein